METPSERKNHAIAFWLLICCAMIFAMVVLGGVTRLTGSGLSMVEWDPIFGVVPPLSASDWADVFAKYRESPEYQKINVGMDLKGFKTIYWFEYAHRLLGRSIATVFLLPFLGFLALGWISRPLIPKLIAMFVLGGLQGLLGWYMVKSGLVDNPHVSQYRLTAHLVAAFVIYGFILWVALDLLYPRQVRADHTPAPVTRYFAVAATGLVLLAIISGGFVAGLKAGLAYNTFPLMDGQWVPEALLLLEPRWRNFFDNIATVQFDHRLLALTTLFTLVGLWFTLRRHSISARVRMTSTWMLIMVIVQVSLGVSTLLLHVPIGLASLHQTGALVLFTLMLVLVHALRER